MSQFSRMPRDKLEENIQYIVYVKVRTIGPERERERVALKIGVGGIKKQ